MISFAGPLWSCCVTTWRTKSSLGLSMDVCINTHKYIVSQQRLFPSKVTFTFLFNKSHPYFGLSGLAYCRHLSTVRTHLSGLVNHTIVEPDVPRDAYGGLTTEVWQTFLQDGSVSMHARAHTHTHARAHTHTHTLTHTHTHTHKPARGSKQTHLNDRLCQTRINIHLSLITDLSFSSHKQYVRMTNAESLSARVAALKGANQCKIYTEVPLWLWSILAD